MKKLKSVIIVLLWIISPTLVLGQAPLIEWQRSYGGNGIDGAASIEKTTDGGFILIGATNSTDQQVSGLHGSFDILVIKIDSLGNLVWQKCYGGSGLDGGEAVKATNDGGYIITGFTESNDGDVSGNHGGAGDLWIVKIDSIGQILWQKCYGGTQGESGYDIQVLPNSQGYLILGITGSNDGDVQNLIGSSDIWIIEIDTLGNIMNEKCFGTIFEDFAFSAKLLQTTDGGLFSSCFSYGGTIYENHSFRHLKINQLGNQEFFTAYGGSEEDEPSSNIQTNDENFVIIGSSRSSDGYVSPVPDTLYDNIWLIKISSTGTLIWTRTLGGNYSDAGRCLLENQDYEIIIGGNTESNNGDLLNAGIHSSAFDWWLSKLDSSGQNILWSKCYGGSGQDEIEDILATDTDGFIGVGSTWSNDGDVSGNHGAMDLWVVKFSNVPTQVSDIAGMNLINVYPNPFSNYITVDMPGKSIITLYLRNTIGQILTTRIIKHKEVIDLSLLPGGVYFLEYIVGNKSEIRKIVKVN